MTISEALDILDIDKKTENSKSLKREAIKLLREKLHIPPKKRYSYWHQYDEWINGKQWPRTTKRSCVESLKSDSIKWCFETFDKKDFIIIPVKVVIRDRWNNNHLIYEGTDYKEFMEAAKKYEKIY